jgi:transcriptional regulator with XRE-family HTH domain
MNAKILRAVRQVNGLNQYEMASRLGISRSYLAKIEAGYSDYPTHLTSKVVNEFGEQLELIKQIQN